MCCCVCVCVSVLLVVAAVGDDDSYACHVTPAQSPHILVVAATTAADLPREHSNYGGEGLQEDAVLRCATACVLGISCVGVCFAVCVCVSIVYELIVWACAVISIRLH